MTLQEVMTELKSLGDEKLRDYNARGGAGDNQFGVKLGDLRKVANRIKTNPALAAELWETGNGDARLLAILLMKPKELSADELDRLVRCATYMQLAEWLTNYIVKQHPQKEELRRKWMADPEPAAARAGWSLTAERIVKDSDGMDIPALLDRIDREMGTADELVQWTMNWTLLEIGINHTAHRERAIEIGEKLGVYRDYPVSKGCTSPFAPIAIREMVKRKG